MNIQIAKKNDCFTVMVIIMKNFFLVVAFNDFVKMYFLPLPLPIHSVGSATRPV